MSLATLPLSKKPERRARLKAANEANSLKGILGASWPNSPGPCSTFPAINSIDWQAGPDVNISAVEAKRSQGAVWEAGDGRSREMFGCHFGCQSLSLRLEQWEFSAATQESTVEQCVHLHPRPFAACRARQRPAFKTSSYHYLSTYYIVLLLFSTMGYTLNGAATTNSSATESQTMTSSLRLVFLLQPNARRI